MKPPRNYASGAAFRVALEDRLKGIARDESLDLQRVRRQAAFDRLLCRLFVKPDAPWLLKGGYAMELRLKTARTTRDIDLALKQLPVPSADWDANAATVLEALREARVEMIVRETIQRGEPRQQEVVLESTALGHPPRHFDISVVPIRTPKNEVRGAVVVFHDITRIKQLEVVRQDFVANVSHELRTPLAIFRGYLETLEDTPDMSREESQRILETMKRHSDRLNALVEDLLILTRLEARKMEAEISTICVDAFFRQLMKDWGNRMNSGAVDIQIDTSGDLPPLDVDALRLEQVMFNLLENAVAYSNPPRRIVLSAALRDGRMEVRVADNGIGIPPNDLPHVFERFYRVDKGRSRTSGGTGLGLSIVKHIVQSHGGAVHAESEVGKGTTIVLRLPLKQGDSSS